MRLLPLTFLIAELGTAAFAADLSWKWLSPELRKTERRRLQIVGELEELGRPMIGLTTVELGFQSHLVPPGQANWIQIDLQEEYPIDTVALFPALVDWRSLERTEYAFPLRFRVDLSNDPDFKTSVFVGDFTKQDVLAPGIAPFVIHTSGHRARYFKLTVTKPLIEEGKCLFALNEIMVVSGNLSVAVGRKISASSTVEMPPRWTVRNLVDGRTPVGPPIHYDPPETDGIFAGPFPGTAQPWMQLDLGEVYPLDQVRVHPVHSRLGGDVPGLYFPRHIKVEVSLTPDFTNSRVLFNSDAYRNPGNNPMTFHAGRAEARYVKITAVACDGTKGRFGLSEIEVYSNNRNVALNSQITRTPDAPGAWSFPWPVERLTDGFTSYGRLLELPEWLRTWVRRRELQTELVGIGTRQTELAAKAEERAEWLLGGVVLLAGFSIAISILVNRHRRQRDLQELRMRLARDLHDDVGSNLAGIVVLSEMAGETSNGDASQTEDWREVNRVARETVLAMRESLWLIGGRQEPDLDLMAHLRQAASRMLAGKEVCWKTSLESLPEGFAIEDRRQLFLFFKEAFSNIAKHAMATRVEISMNIAHKKLLVDIQDNGRGFDTRNVRAGIGLMSQQMRARALRGRVSYRSAPGDGTSIRLEVPLSRVKAPLLPAWANSHKN